MAAATVNRKRTYVDGSRRVHVANITIANNGDTYAVPSLHIIEGYSIDPTINGTLGATIAGNVLTFAYAGGAETISVEVIGQ